MFGPDLRCPKWLTLLLCYWYWVFWSETRPEVSTHGFHCKRGDNNQDIRSKDNSEDMTSSSAAKSYVNLFSQYLRTSDVFPTQPSPNKTTLNCCWLNWLEFDVIILLVSKNHDKQQMIFNWKWFKKQDFYGFVYVLSTRFEKIVDNQLNNKFTD